uniref:Uncharacterized protein n=1 Tax=Siphoviridae sp. ctGfF74 TaxID=2826223 RepID=A0A8S5NJP0_9CAUD|nr:MAG TPA: hypothetical protein [Siphoviridae sp. ctGfF74]
MSYIPEPITRIDKYLAYIAGNMDVALPDHPITRKEHYLAAWAEKSGFEDVDVAGDPPLTLENGIGKPLKGLRIYGNSTQVTTTGAQLWDEDNALPGWITSTDGGIASATAVGNELYNTYHVVMSLNICYTYSATVPDSQTKQSLWIAIGCYDKDKVFLSRVVFEENNATGVQKRSGLLILPNGTKYIRISWTKYADGVLMINEGSTHLPWEPYTGGKPSPSPDYPQEIESVGQDGEIGVEVYGGNLFNARTAINGKVVDKHTGSMLSNSRYACSDYIAIPCNAVSLYQNGGTKNQRAFYDSDKNFIAAEVSVNPVTVPKNAKYIRITSDIDKQDMNNIMLSISSTALPYEPYHAPQSMSISAPNGLPGIPVSSGGNYTDADGQQWVCDEVDFARGVYVQRVYKSKLADLYSYFDGSGSYSCTIYDMSQLQTSVLCNIAKYEFNYNGNGCYIYNNTIVFGTRFCSKFATYDDFKNMLQEKSAIAYTVLATPIETPLASDQLAAYKALHTYKGTTIIDNDAGAYMSVKYEKMK